MPLSERVWLSHSKWLSEESNKSASNFALSLNIALQKLFRWFRRPQLWAAGNWSSMTATCPLMHHVSCRDFCKASKSYRRLSQAPYSPDLAPSNFWLFLKPKSSLKRKRFQTVNEIQENTTGQLMVIGRTVGGPKVPTLKGTEASLSYVQCFLYLLQ